MGTEQIAVTTPGENEELHGLILEIYDTAINPATWPAVLDKCAWFAGGIGAVIFSLEGEKELSVAHMAGSYEPALMDEYLRLHRQQERVDQDRFEFFSKRTDGIELISDQVIAGSEDELRDRPNVQMLKQWGIRHRAGALLNKDNINRDRFSLQFSKAHGPLTSEDIRKTALILPHIAKALDVSRPAEQLFLKFRSVLSYIDRVNVGVCFLNGDGSVILKNAEFDRQIETFAVFRISASGKLQIDDPETNKSIRRLMADVSTHGHFGARPRKEAVVSLLNGEECCLCIEVTPFHVACELGTKPISGHILYSLDTSRPAVINAPLMTDLFKLTAAEAEVLCLMAEGLTNPEISDRRGTLVTTTSTQTKSILGKTSTSNRTQLIRLATTLSSSFLS